MCQQCVRLRGQSGEQNKYRPCSHSLRTLFFNFGLLCLYAESFQSCLTLRPSELQPSGLLCPWDSPGKNNGVDSHFLLQGIFLTQGSNPPLMSPALAGSVFTSATWEASGQGPSKLLQARIKEHWEFLTLYVRGTALRPWSTQILKTAEDQQTSVRGWVVFNYFILQNHSVRWIQIVPLCQCGCA